MKRFLTLAFLLVALAGFSQGPEGTSRNYWYNPIQVQAKNILPRPAYADALMAYKNGRWGEVRFQYGTVTDTLSETGTYTVDITVESADYYLFLSPISALGHNLTVSDKTDSTFTFTAWIDDTVANQNIITVDWHLREH